MTLLLQLVTLCRVGTSVRVEPLSPYPDSHSDSEYYAARHGVRYERGSDEPDSEAASGSGSSTSDTPTIVDSLEIYIEVTLKISVEEYVRRQEVVEAGILEVLQTYLSADAAAATVKRSSSEDHVIHLSLIREKSSTSESVLQVAVVDSETGEQNVTVTAELYNKLAAEPAKFIEELEKATGIVSQLFLIVSHFLSFVSVSCGCICIARSWLQCS